MALFFRIEGNYLSVTINGRGEYEKILFIFLTMLTARVCRSTGIPPVATVPVNMCSRSVLSPGQV